MITYLRKLDAEARASMILHIMDRTVKNVIAINSNFDEGKTSFETHFHSGSIQEFGVWDEPLQKMQKFIEDVYCRMNNCKLENFKDIIEAG